MPPPELALEATMPFLVRFALFGSLLRGKEHVALQADPPQSEFPGTTAAAAGLRQDLPTPKQCSPTALLSPEHLIPLSHTRILPWPLATLS